MRQTPMTLIDVAFPQENLPAKLLLVPQISGKTRPRKRVGTCLKNP
jgi:hypothetical protein